MSLTNNTIIKAQNGDKNSIEEVINSTKNMAYKYINKINMNILEKADYEQYVAEGIMKAIGRFDVDRKVKFSTFANNYIKKSILYDSLPHDNFGYKTTRYDVGLIFDFNKIKKLNPKLTDMDIFKELNWGKIVQRNYYKLRKGVAYNMGSHGEDGEGGYEFNEDTESYFNATSNKNNEVLEAVLEIQQNKLLHELIESLDDAEEDYILMRFGFEPYDRVHHYKEISEKHNIPISTLKVKINTIIRKMKIKIDK